VIDAAAIARDTAALVQAPSLTGDERPALERLGELAAGLGFEPELQAHDLAALRAHPDHPGEEAPREELLGLTVTLPGTRAGRVCLNGHVDVVGPGSGPWRHEPFSGVIEDGYVHGRGSVDMKGGVVAALHALAELREGERPEVVLQAVGSEEDGGLGTFAALERDAAFDACLITEPTAYEVVCAQAGALTFRATVRGRAAHAAMRLEGRSALDRYVGLHLAIQAHERQLNRHVEHPAMRALALPYPISVGVIEGGEWSSSVPDRVTVEGRLGVPLGRGLAEARAAFEGALDDGGSPPVEVEWTGGQFAPGATPPGHPWVTAVADAVRAERGSPARLTGVPYGADMRQFCARGIPAVMVGTPGLELAHAVDERVRVDDLAALARIIVRATLNQGSGGWAGFRVEG
jgi:acetylornithine deacetylase